MEGKSGELLVQVPTVTTGGLLLTPEIVGFVRLLVDSSLVSRGYHSSLSGGEDDRDTTWFGEGVTADQFREGKALSGGPSRPVPDKGEPTGSYSDPDAGLTGQPVSVRR